MGLIGSVVGVTGEPVGSESVAVGVPAAEGIPVAVGSPAAEN